MDPTFFSVSEKLSNWQDWTKHSTSQVQENKLIGKNLHKTYKSSQNFNQILTFKSTLGLCGSSTNETIGKSLLLQFCRRLSGDMTSCHFDFLKLFYIGIALWRISNSSLYNETGVLGYFCWCLVNGVRKACSSLKDLGVTEAKLKSI